MEQIKQNPKYRSGYIPEIYLPIVTTIESSTTWGEQGEKDIAFNYVKVDYPKKHIHNHWELFVILGGQVDHEINNEKFTLEKGNVCLIRPNDSHRLVNHKDFGQEYYQHINFVISTRFINKYFDFINTSLFDKICSIENSLPSFFISQPLIKEIMKKTIDMQTHKKPTPTDMSCCKLIIFDLLNIFLNNLYSENLRYPNWLSDFLIKLNTPVNFDKSVEELSKLTIYSYSRLSRLFKKYVGLSLVKYVQNIKIDYAKTLLKNTDLTIATISNEINFSSVGHFNKIFKEITKITPKDFRHAHKNKV